MPIKSNRMSKKLTILLISMFLAVVAMVLAIGISGAWFTDSDTKTKNSTTPYVSVSLNNASGTHIQQVVTLTTSTTVSLLVDGNVDLYLRAKVVPQFVDSEGNFITGYDIDNYFTITYNNSWGVPSGVDGYFKYYGSPTVIGTAATTSPISINLISNVTSVAQLPADVTVQLQLFAEVIQATADAITTKWA